MQRTLKRHREQGRRTQALVEHEIDGVVGRPERTAPQKRQRNKHARMKNARRQVVFERAIGIHQARQYFPGKANSEPTKTKTQNQFDEPNDYKREIHDLSRVTQRPQSSMTSNTHSSFSSFVMRPWLLALVGICSHQAQAWPVDWVHELSLKKIKFVKLPQVDSVECLDPMVATAEWTPEPQELILTGIKAGKTRLLLAAEGKMAVWALNVDQKVGPPNKLLELAKTACPKLEYSPNQMPQLSAVVASENCRRALGALFETDLVEARSLSLEFSQEMLQAQLKGIQAALKAAFQNGVKARYVGAGLIVEGTLSAAEHSKMLWILFEKSLGRVALDDRTELKSNERQP
jgi:hypothetical protein